jgi:predicted Zn finger-like uncharacterized protein
MIIKCEKCESEFNLNEDLLKKSGSTVRCSICKNVFKVFPKVQETSETTDEDDFSITAMEETVALDLPPDLDGFEPDTIEEDKEYSFDKAFEDAMEEVSEEEGVTSSDEELIAEETESDSLTEEDQEEDTADEDGKKGKSKLLLIILLSILCLIIVSMIIFFVFPGVIPESIYSRQTETKLPVATDAGITQLNFKGVTGLSSKSDKAGDLFIIKGTVINNDSESRSYILLKGGILDKENKPVIEETVYAGNNFSDDQLKQMSKEEIKTAMQNRSGTDNSDVDVKPGASVPFMIIFTDLPEKSKLVYLTVEAVNSSIGK